MVKRLVVLALVLGADASADTQFRLRPGMTGVADIGTTGCAFFNELHYNGPTGMQQQVLTWIQGYLYAKDGTTIDSLLAGLPADNGWNFDTLSAVFVSHCKANPDDTVAVAAMALVERLLASTPARQ
jgi:hypothetical protein